MKCLFSAPMKKIDSLEKKLACSFLFVFGSRWGWKILSLLFFSSSYVRKDFYVIPSDFHSFGGIQPSERKRQRTENVAALGGRGGKIIPLSVRLHLSEEAGICFPCISLLLPERRCLFLLLYTCTARTAVTSPWKALLTSKRCISLSTSDHTQFNSVFFTSFIKTYVRDEILKVSAIYFKINPIKGNPVSLSIWWTVHSVYKVVLTKTWLIRNLTKAFKIYWKPNFNASYYDIANEQLFFGCEL